MVLLHQMRIEKLSDASLLRGLKSLTQKEKATTLEILLHLNEVEKRSLHLSQGYSSLFDYCTRHLGYSESAASRRIRTARCIRDYPRAYEMVAAGDVTLITVSMIAGVLTPDIAAKLLFRIVGESQREVEAIVSAYRPAGRVREKVTPVTILKKPAGPGLFDDAPDDGLSDAAGLTDASTGATRRSASSDGTSATQKCWIGKSHWRVGQHQASRRSRASTWSGAGGVDGPAAASSGTK